MLLKNSLLVWNGRNFQLNSKIWWNNSLEWTEICNSLGHGYNIQNGDFKMLFESNSWSNSFYSQELDIFEMLLLIMNQYCYLSLSFSNSKIVCYFCGGYEFFTTNIKVGNGGWKLECC